VGHAYEHRRYGCDTTSRPILTLTRRNPLSSLTQDLGPGPRVAGLKYP